MSNKLKIPIFVLSVLTLGACDTFLGVRGKPPLPGKRISILAHESTLTPDAAESEKKILLPAPTPNAEWPQAGGFANHAMHHIRVSGSMKESWSTSIGSGTDDEDRLMAQPVLADGKIFTMDSETVVSAFNAKTGDELWSVDLTPDEEDDDHINGGLAYEGGRVYASTGFGQVIAINAKDGKVKWRRAVGSPMRSAPTARGNRIFVITLTNKLLALNGDTGHVLWTHSGIEETTNLLGGGSPAVDGGVVVAPYSSGEIVALKIENGQELWSESLAGVNRASASATLSTIRGRPIIDRGVVYAISNSSQFTAINLRSGRRIWERQIGGIESPWIAGDYLFAITNNSELLAVGRLNGRIHWVTSLPHWEDPEERQNRINWTGPVLTSDRLIVAGSTGEALSISPYSGRILGKVEMPDAVAISPIVALDTIFFLSEDAELVAYR
ncbi:MAG: pyrrolo-quinoline quinone [Rhodospirillaceae bacterium]|nr:pyrrolo-quinoline quinone [Rhodospirillaceae bacterium]